MQRENFTRSHCKSERRDSQKLKLLLKCIIHLLKPIHDAHCGHFSLPGQINPLEADTASRPRTDVPSSDRWDSYRGFQVSEKNPSKSLSKYHGGGGAEMGQRVLQGLTMQVPFPRTGPHNLKEGGMQGSSPCARGCSRGPATVRADHHAGAHKACGPFPTAAVTVLPHRYRQGKAPEHRSRPG